MGNGFLRWDCHRALWGESTLQKTLKLCRERLTGIYGIKSNKQGGVRFPKTLWVSVLKRGADGGARSSLIKARGQAMHHFVNTHL